MPTLTHPDYHFLSEILRTGSGLVLGPHKQYLVQSRLMPLCHERGFDSIGVMIEQLRTEDAPYPLRKLVNELMTTNESFFFRDPAHFDFLCDQLLPKLYSQNQNRRQLMIWSAACSTGQEPLSIAITLRESKLDWTGWKIRILASDLSLAALKQARSGLYSGFEIERGMPAALRTRYFEPEGSGFRAKADLVESIEFQALNLLEPTIPIHPGSADIVFLRNVLIYFETSVKADLLQRVARISAHDGCLFLGGTETAFGISPLWTPMPEAPGSIYIQAPVSPQTVSSDGSPAASNRA